MSVVHTNQVLSKLEAIVSFRLGRDKSQKHPIKVQSNSPFAGNSGPATDGTEIFLPRTESHFVRHRDNELSLADSTAHEADHIAEYYEYFGSEIESLQSKGANIVEVYHHRNHSNLTENPALAGWIDNVVKDRRIDANRREQLPGVKRYFEEVLAPAAEYFRPSTKGMSELDAFRELYLQEALIGRTVERVPESKQALLEEVVAITNKSDSIHKDKETVERIYSLFRKEFDISQPISILPPQFGTGDHSQTRGSPQQGYGKPIKPREGRDDDSLKPEGIGSRKNKDKNKPGSNLDERKPSELPHHSGDGKDRDQLYQDAQEECGIRVYVTKPDLSARVQEYENQLRSRYAGEIESMKRVFRQLQLKHYGDRRDFSGEELDFEFFMQDQLESEVTGIRGQGKYFKTFTKNAQRPAWAVLADISPSTDPSNYNLVEPIKASLLIQAESLGVTDYPFGLYAFSGDVHVLKDFREIYGPEVSNKIVSVRRKNDGTYLGNSLRVVGSLLRKQKETPKGITIITDGESQNIDDAKDAINEMYDQRMHPFLIVIGAEFDKYAKHLTQDIGHEHYSIIERDSVHELPGEMFRLFKTYGISR